MEKLLVICGPTAVGKSSLGVGAAKKHSGEVISADSRQVYRGLDIATGKITTEEMEDVPHHLLDVADPDEDFSVADFKKRADEAVSDIHDRGKLPILCGGTGFYIQAVVDNLALPNVPPNKPLREKLSKKSARKLFAELEKKDSRRAAQIDPHNPHRIIRALEIVNELGEVPKLKKQERFNTLLIGLDRPDKELKHRIIARTKERFEAGILEEAEDLYENRLSLERMRELGLEYEHLADYIDGVIDKETLFANIVHGDWQYARRQRTWFKKDKRITWFHPEADRESIEKCIENFMEKE